MKTILVVDDEWIIASVLEEILVEAGYHVVTAPNGRVALERIMEARPDAIILDYMMPVMNGGAMLAELRRSPEGKNIPVILMTSLPEASVEHEVKGHSAFLQKPFLDTDLLAIVERALSLGKP